MSSSTLIRWVAGTAACLLAISAFADDTATLQGRVTLPSGEPATNTRVFLVEAGHFQFVGDDGTFRFEGVTHGRYHLRAESQRFGTAVREIDVAGDLDLTIVMEVSFHAESIVVSAGAVRGANEVYQPVEILEKADLSLRQQPTIGETLSKESGVRSTYFGPGSSRPIIRGQGANRIRVLESGVGVGDASNTSPDHAVSSDPALAERVEVLRGPSTLLYGSTAIGGAVNILDNRVPDHKPNRAVAGGVNARYGSAADERNAAAEVNGAFGPIAWHADGSVRRTDDYAIPGRQIDDDPDSAVGTMPNSSLESESYTLGLSWIGEHGYVGASGRRFTTNYGIPSEEGEDGPRIDLDQMRYDIRGGFHGWSGGLDGIEFRLGISDYEHVELEEGEIATEFLTDAWEGRLELPHHASDTIRGVAGAQVGRREVEAIGDEAFVPPSRTDAWAAFAMEEFRLGEVTLEAGLRFEGQDTSTDEAGLPDRSFTGVSTSVGVVWQFGDGYALTGSLSRPERIPTTEELYADGPHLATGTYERGDPFLEKEIGLGADVGIRDTEGRLTWSLNAFVTDFSDYIFEAPTGEVEDGLPVFQFFQGASTFVGFEADLTLDLLGAPDHDLDWRVFADNTQAELDDGSPLPLIPALYFGTELRYRGPRWYAYGTIGRTDEQDDVPSFSEPVAGYTLVDAGVGYRITTKHLMHDILLRGTNLTDETARPATSRLREVAPLPGRDISLVYRLVF